MLSMTGYGRATVERDGRQLTVELKSVNHRFLDLAFRMPRNLAFLEEDARRAIGARLARGHVDVFMTYRNLRNDARTVSVDTALFDAYANALESVSDRGLKDDRTLMNIARMPDVMIVTEAEEDQDALKALLSETMNAALDPLGHGDGGGSEPEGGRDRADDARNRSALSADGFGISESPARGD